MLQKDKFLFYLPQAEEERNSENSLLGIQLSMYWKLWACLLLPEELKSRPVFLKW